ncbi:DUF1624 domain-containing protein [Dyadobacter psychrotolerans]|uniref:DUF1624 domain-containing protein n=1 Tax=Dyadobacter psychrotolerans TaxID=2541721 RepID=A0A4R5DKM3_9BACT|nr:heparan-alpha-glucosaminide N-acetyltransferase domain-containing protein [Dyadobacter psychrotolerans]TDE14599.1 DUF1624 domain-containing protein [Dyadobacter psychrotolerans]
MSVSLLQSEPTSRIKSIDTIRGAIMIIMALDHVREFFLITAFTQNPVDPQTTTPILFFTRWITHYCAPSFMLLSGISAYLAGSKRSATETSLFLIKRGFWIVLIEVTLMTFILSFDISYKFILLNVLWALGCCMIVTGIFVRFFSAKAVLVFGLVLILGHNVFDFIKVTPNSVLDIILNIFFTAAGKFYPVGGRTIAVFYVILPWAGVMMSGYGLGKLYDKDFDAGKRKKILLLAGLSATLIFIVLRFANGYGDPALWTTQKESWRTVLSFFNVSKYPPSLLFTLMTVGPVLILLSFTDSTSNRLTKFLSVYGKVPFFYFIVHFSLIHVLSAITVLLTGYTWKQATDPELFFKFRPFDFGFELGWVYLIWIAIVLSLYFPCKWYGKYKTEHKAWWLSYL